MFWFLDLEFDTPLRYTDCDVDLWGVANFIRRLTEDGDFRVTESGDVRILEQGYESNKYETMPFSPSSFTSLVLQRPIRHAKHTPVNGHEIGIPSNASIYAISIFFDFH